MTNIEYYGFKNLLKVDNMNSLYNIFDDDIHDVSEIYYKAKHSKQYKAGIPIYKLMYDKVKNNSAEVFAKWLISKKTFILNNDNYKSWVIIDGNLYRLKHYKKYTKM